MEDNFLRKWTETLFNITNTVGVKNFALCEKESTWSLTYSLQKPWLCQ
jgi:hypothetical protein